MAQYDQFSSDYHWLYSDAVLSGEPFLERHRDLLISIPAGAKVLDCACGIGVHAFALARRGFSVRGSDSSRGMVARARERVQDKEVDLSFVACPWHELPQTFDREFDLAFCVGNALGHCRGREEMLSSLRGIRGVLKKHGLLVMDSRNWERLRTERPRFSVLGVRIREGIRCIPLYVWSYPAQLEEEHRVEVVLVFEEEGRVHERHYAITYHPFRYAELCDRLKEAGFSDIRSDFEKKEGSYRLTARND
jgi:SAM-dependent methyltransferase